MIPEIVAVLGILVLFIFIAARVWIGAAMAIVGFAGLVVIRGMDQALSQIGAIPFQNVNSYTMTVVPMFTLMGMIIAETQIGADLFKAAHNWLGHMRGGLASATIVAAGLMGAITGSHTSGTVIMGKVALPEMLRYNYDVKLATGAVAAGAPLSILIPPSLAFVLYGILTEQSIGELFMAGMVPGIVMIILFIIFITILCKINPNLGPAAEKTSLKEKMASLKGIWATIVLFVLVLGGIYGGIFTSTESGAIGAFGALVISLVNRQMNLEIFIKCLRQTAVLTGMILFLLAGTYIFISFMTVSKLPFLITNWISGLDVSVTVIIFFIALMYILLGMFLPEFPMIVLTIPIIYPSILALGIDPIWFGVFVVLLMTMGAISPPVGIVCFILSGISKVPLGTVFRGAAPFMLAQIIVLILVVIFPGFATFLPNMMK